MAKLFAFNIHGHQHIVENNWNCLSCAPRRIPTYRCLRWWPCDRRWGMWARIFRRVLRADLLFRASAQQSAKTFNLSSLEGLDNCNFHLATSDHFTASPIRLGSIKQRQTLFYPLHLSLFGIYIFRSIRHEFASPFLEKSNFEIGRCRQFANFVWVYFCYCTCYMF